MNTDLPTSPHEMDGGRRAAQPNAPFAIRVLGGTFRVHEVFPRPEESVAAAVAFIRSVPEDRWFVMVSDRRDAYRDTLAMIDDELEFQVFAQGSLEQD